MRDVTASNFGILIAYLIPGLITVWGLGAVVPGLESLLVSEPQSEPTVGGFLYLTVASVGAGLFVSTVRWMLLDTLHHWTGLKRRALDFSRFHEIGGGYDPLNELHYRYYQAHGNALIALAFSYVAHRFSGSAQLSASVSLDVAICLVLLVLFLGSRDTLRKYYERLNQLMGSTVHQDSSEE
jgi:hypothetical protein